MTLSLHKSASRIRAQRDRLLALQSRVRQQISDADCLIATLEEYCRENPDDCACAANDPNWQQQLTRQREDLAAMHLAIREKLKKYTMRGHKTAIPRSQDITLAKCELTI